MAMSTMKDIERLELLKEIGGTKVYEERRRSSLKILHDTDSRRQRIDEVVRSGSCQCSCAVACVSKLPLMERAVQSTCMPDARCPHSGSCQ